MKFLILIIAFMLLVYFDDKIIEWEDSLTE